MRQSTRQDGHRDELYPWLPAVAKVLVHTRDSWHAPTFESVPDDSVQYDAGDGLGRGPESTRGSYPACGKVLPEWSIQIIIQRV